MSLKAIDTTAPARDARGTRKATSSKRADPKGACRSTWIRILRLDSLVRAGKFPNRKTIADEFEVHLSVISNDVFMMRNRLGLPLEWDGRNNGYYYSQPVAELPSEQITEGELLAVTVAKRALQSYPGLTFTKPLLGMIEKLMRKFSDEFTTNPAEFEELISFHPGENIVPVEPAVFDAVASGLLQGRQIRLVHRKPGERVGKGRKVRPVHLSMIDNSWYLFVAGSEGAKRFPKYALNRISEVMLTDQTFPRIKFDPTKALANCMGVYGAEKTEIVELLFTRKVAPFIMERPWRTMRKKEALPTGEVRMTLGTGNTPELIRWILSWGADVKVLGPEPVREKLREHVAQMAADLCAG